MLSYLDLVNACNCYGDDFWNGRYKFVVEGIVVGAITPPVAEALKGEFWQVEDGKVTLLAKDFNERSRVINDVLRDWSADGTFKAVQKWRNELYPVYSEGKELLRMERAGSALFGIVTYGVHMTAYVQGNPMKIWVARRSKTKGTYPSMLDNSVAGGISAGEKPLASMVRECAEEASLPEDVVLRSLQAAGCTSYTIKTDERYGQADLICPEVEYVYDLPLPEDQILKPYDDEVGSFELMDVAEVQKAMAAGEFKPNCALILVDFFVRHGIITPDNEPDFIKIVTGLHLTLPFPTA